MTTATATISGRPSPADSNMIRVHLTERDWVDVRYGSVLVFDCDPRRVRVYPDDRVYGYHGEKLAFLVNVEK